jgi:GrpB-like predicted nucleotidyltransferase (UPF0157 family)
MADVGEVVARHKRTIAEALHGATVELSGSTLLGSYSGHDIDLVVLVESVAAAAERLLVVYPPLYRDEWRDDWAVFRDAGPPQVDVVVTTPGTKGDLHHRRAWDLLLANDVLRAEYAELKRNGMSSTEKAAFFDRVVAMLERQPPWQTQTESSPPLHGEPSNQP